MSKTYADNPKIESTSYRGLKVGDRFSPNGQLAVYDVLETSLFSYSGNPDVFNDGDRVTLTVRNEHGATEILSRLPSHYRVSRHIPMEPVQIMVVEGEDDAGWTLDGYVIPRLASGLIFAREENP